MKCFKCGSDNLDNAQICSNCGSSLVPVVAQSADNQGIVQNIGVNDNSTISNVQSPVAPVSDINNSQTNDYVNSNVEQQQVSNSSSKNNASSDSKLNLVKYLVNFVIKPVETYNNEKDKLSDTKNSFIIAGIVSVMIMISILVSSIISAVRVSSYFSSSTSWEWDNLKDINFLSICGKSLVIGFVVIVAISGIYYLASLVVKKNGDFKRILSVVASSSIAFVLSVFLSPILGLIWSDLSSLILIIGIVYFLITFIVIVNDELQLESNTKVYFNLVCLVIIFIVLYFILQRVLLSSFGF